jgi:hypothetical protein
VTTPTPKAAVFTVRACDCNAATLQALGAEGYRYDAAGLSGLLYFVRDGGLTSQPPAATPERGTYDE